MESRSLRTLLLLFLAMGTLFLLCGALTFILAGDQLVDVIRDVTRDFRLSRREDELVVPMGTNPDPVNFVIEPGEGAGQIASNLVAKSLIADGDLFVDYVIAEGLDSRFASGTYFLRQTMSIKDVAAALTSNDFRAIEFTVFGGQRIEEIAEVIDAVPRIPFDGASFLTVVGRGAQVDPSFAEFAGLPAGASVEGFLLPGTYLFPADVTPQMMRNMMLDNFRESVSGEIMQQATAQGYSLYDVVTLASIVQREALYDEERALIAGVYRNRLERSDPDTGQQPPLTLDADPTVQYPLGQAGNWWPNITAADYQGVDSSYNTYRHEDLPPGPIANPSLASIRAVVFPEATDFFYFRADCRTDGLHDFALNYQEHLENGC